MESLPFDFLFRRDHGEFENAEDLVEYLKRFNVSGKTIHIGQTKPHPYEEKFGPGGYEGLFYKKSHQDICQAIHDQNTAYHEAIEPLQKAKYKLNDLFTMCFIMPALYQCMRLVHMGTLKHGERVFSFAFTIDKPLNDVK